MKNILYIVIVMLLSTITYGCKENSRTAKVVESYKQGEISNDSLLSFLSDSTNYQDALNWANSHKGDHDFADYILGRAYKLGMGVESDINKSKCFYRSAATNGNVNAMTGLGEIYAKYFGHEDLDSAYYWFNEAVKKGDASHYMHLVMVAIDRNIKLGLPLDTALIVSHLEKGTSLNDPHCTANLASLYINGFGVKKDISKAFIMLAKIPEDKLDSFGLFLLGQMYELGEGTSTNFNEAFRLIKKSAEKGNTRAICKLGNFYQVGQGVEQNDSLAYIQYKKAADAGNPWGMRCVGTCYLNGIGVKQNVENAWVWFKSAAKNGDIESINFCEKNNVKYNE